MFLTMVVGAMLAERMSLLKPSGTMAMAEKARQLAERGRRILHLEIGEPNFDTPRHIVEAAYEAMKGGFTHYTSSRGILELREAISEDLKRRGVEADPNTEIIVTPGAKHAIYCACMATLNPGDEVLALSPTWPTHFTCAEFAGAKVIEVPCGETYTLDEEELKGRITDRSRMIILSSPNNPTGGVLSVENLKAIADIAEDHNLLILSDEIYDRITYDGVEVKSIASLDNTRDRVITVNGFSKTYAMTGWRLGYAAANKTIIDAMNKIQQTTTTCPSSFIQKAGVTALRGPQDCVEDMVKEYDRRRRFIVERLNEIDGVYCPKPKGAFYTFPRLPDTGMSSVDVSMRLLEEEGVCTTPGTVFGEYGESHIRISYATSLEVISEAVERMKRFFERHKK
ncbi:pyridoxal phosphate-dependent aminotransferase [Candidatus Bathyarchaeota archaeon]|nr:MAG: pyridoxal phosphate-dependent aminotransferase [Candidatus Bathyarchaeota archaeon]